MIPLSMHLNWRLKKMYPWKKYEFLSWEISMQVDVTDKAVNDFVVFTLVHIPNDNQAAFRTTEI